MMEIKISDMMDYITDDTVPLQIKNMAASDKIKETVMKKLHTNNNVVKRTRKTSTILIAAVLIAALLTGTAYATGIAQSIFGAMKGVYIGDDESKYETIDSFSNKEETSVTIPELNGSRFTLSQSYYDGEQLMLGYTLDAITKPAEFGFGPGSDGFDELINCEEFSPQLLTPAYLKEKLTVGEYAQFEKALEETGSAGVVFYNRYVSDHVTLADGTDIGPYIDTVLDNGVYLEFETPLADEAQNQDELQILIKINTSIYYYFQDSTGSYYNCELGEPERIPFTIPRCTG